MASKVFINLPVKDLKKSIEFFTKLGFTFNPQFTDDKATCMIISENIFVMLLVEGRFRDFTSKQLADASKVTEVIIAIDAESRTSVDEMMDKVIDAGGQEHNVTQDYGWMYVRSFTDINDHIWEVIHLDEAGLPDQQVG